MAWKLSNLPGGKDFPVEQATAAPGEKRDLGHFYEKYRGVGPVRMTRAEWLEICELAGPMFDPDLHMLLGRPVTFLDDGE